MVRSRGEILFSKIATYLVLIFGSIFSIFPFLWMISTALKPDSEIYSTKPSFFSSHFSLKNFVEVLQESDFLTFFKNSFLVSVVTTIIGLIIAVLAGYALSRFGRFKSIKIAGLSLTISQMVPGVLLLIPIYMIFKNLNLINTYTALILAYSTFVIPLSTFMMKGFFDSIPISLEESAALDGASRSRTLVQIILPVSIPSLVSTGLYTFVTAWNEYMFGYVLISDVAHRTLTPGITLFRGQFTTDWGNLMAASVLAVIPVTIIFAFLQRYLISGLMSGAVKG
ncbi:carbohydrate ABC transporter permease [Heyndrickxia coagulans]|uniref:carbohydrate ABC transporter permease n=1 Tax=Heyndrickxia coagulans TaxID=1398 RepID=UPI00041FB2C1|nr:carbohydrate ABC transporter permease [Heyndrickxia coagulans]